MQDEQTKPDATPEKEAPKETKPEAAPKPKGDGKADLFEFDFMDHRSIGKKVMKLRPVLLDGGKTDMTASIKRNWMFALGGLVQVLMFIPVVGWALIPVVGVISLILAIIEIVLILTDPEGRRLGDKIAGTKVIEVES